MSSVVSAIIGGQSAQNVANTQAGQSNYAVDVGASTQRLGIQSQADTALAALQEQAKESQMSNTTTQYGMNLNSKTGLEEAGIASDTAKYGTDVAAKTAAANLAQQESQYKGTQDIASKQLAEASAGINSATSSTPSELLSLKSDIEKGNTRAMQDTAKQVGANLATQGVRGGQAAVLQNRAVGEQGLTAEQNIDELLAQDAAQRRAAQTGYYTSIGSGAMGKV